MNTAELKDICETFTDIIEFVNIRPLTDMVEIYSKNGMAYIGSTDNRTTIVASLKNENDIDNVVVSLSALTKLVKLTTKDTITLTNKNRYVEFKGNGKYKLPIQTDEMGNDLSLELDMPDMEKDISVYDSSIFEKTLERNEVGLFEGDDHNEFKLYYNNNGNIVTSDSLIVANTYNMDIIAGNIQPFVVKQLSCLTGKIKVCVTESGYRCSCNNYELYMVNKLYDEFPIEMVAPFIVEPYTNIEMFPNHCVISKKEFLSAIKRQHIFKSVYDTPSIILTIRENSVTLSNEQDTSTENLIITYESLINPLRIKIETSIVLKVLKNMDDDILLYVGEQVICLKDKYGFYVISSMDSE